MKKTNKQWFTLVELLAVIVILGVLLLIAVPAIQNVINSSKSKAFVSQAKLVIENVETAISVADTVTMPENSSSCVIALGDIKLDRGSLNSYNGKVTVEKLSTPDKNGKLYKTTIDISNGTYSITKGTTEINAVDKEYSAATDVTTTCDWYNK